MRIADLIKRLARLLFRDYSIYYIYSCACTGEIVPSNTKFRFAAVEKSEIGNSKDEVIFQQAWYHGKDTYAYACIEGSRIVGLCFFWYGERYRERNFWPLENQEAKLVQLVVLPEMRGRGIARHLIKFSMQEMSRQGFKYLYARIWWSNTPSLRAFEHAEWRRIAMVIEIYISDRNKPFKLKLTRIFSKNG